MAYQHCMMRDGGQPSSMGSQSNAFCSHTDLEPIECKCGEEEAEFAWVWSSREEGGQAGSVVLGAERRQITFNPEYSSGTAAVRGFDLLSPNLHHYWELKMTSAVYGTDIMVGVCTAKCDLSHGVRRFCSLLGRDTESWGYSYTGSVHHGGKFRQYGPRWGKGSIVGLHLDGWRGTLSFFLNRKPLGLAFSGLQNKELYPIVSSTSAHSGMKLVTSCTVPANLQFMASEAVFLHLRQETKVPPADLPLPPGLRSFVENNFWPFLRSLGQRKKIDQECDGGWFARGTKRPHSADDSNEDLTRIKRVRRRLHLHTRTVSSSDETSPSSSLSGDFTDCSTMLHPSSSLSQVSESSLFFGDPSTLIFPLTTNSSVPPARNLLPVVSSEVASSVIPSSASPVVSTVAYPLVSSVVSAVAPIRSHIASALASPVESTIVSVVASSLDSPVVSSVASPVNSAVATPVASTVTFSSSKDALPLASSSASSDTTDSPPTDQTK